MAIHKTEKTPRCNNCTSPEQDDPQRTIIVIRGEEKSMLIIKCPNVDTPFGKGCSLKVPVEK